MTTRHGRHAYRTRAAALPKWLGFAAEPRPRPRRPRDRAVPVAGALGLGAGLMYVLDPAYGRRRRALVRDQLTHLFSIADDALGATTRDMANRARGLVAEARAMLFESEVPDEILEQRVRSKLGFYVSHPSSIGVVADAGRIFLSGPILAGEKEALVAALRRMRGVHTVESRLDVHERPRDISGLQGGVARKGEVPEIMQSNWSPTARVLAGLAGGALASWGAVRRGQIGMALGLVGAGLVARGATNLEIRRLIGVGAGRRAVDVAKTILVGAPVEQVYAFWRDYRNFPSFMSHVRDVRDRGNDCSHWVVDGPAGSTIEWDATVTVMEPNRILAWKTVPGAAVEHAGIVRFEPADGGTRVHVRMSYNPPVGAIGHGIAAMLGADARRLVNDDLVRMRTFLETGRPPRDAAERRPS